MPPSSNPNCLIAAGVGEKARGYSLGSRSDKSGGGLITSGARDTVVVVVVVTVVCCVAGAKENCPADIRGGSMAVVVSWREVDCWGSDVVVAVDSSRATEAAEVEVLEVSSERWLARRPGG